MKNNFINFPYKRPIPFINYPQLSIVIAQIVLLKDNKTNIIIPYEISCIKFLNKPGDSTTFPEFDFNSESSKLQATYINIKHNCFRVAELINNQLRNFLMDYDNEVKIETKEIINKLDFMKLRDNLSLIIKKDNRFWDLEIFNSNENRNLFTKTFTEFIEDRNIYAHGHLIINLEDMAILIEYKNKIELKSLYCTVNNDCLQSFFQTYMTLRETLHSMINIIKK